MKIYRQIKSRLKNILILIFLITLITGCYKYPEFNDISYNEYRRVIGPEGGIINFYDNYYNDSIKDIIVKMEFPENAVDTMIVFNMYDFFDDVTSNELFVNLNTIQYSDFLYFVPFYESDGYKPADAVIEKHTSINFNIPVKITYFYSFFEDIPDSTKLYRIKIPKEDEWGEENNVWIKYNYQGYPTGYKDIDLIYLINGKWTQNNPWGTGNLSLANWEEVSNYTFNTTEKSIMFNINSTDYMYVMTVIN